MGAGTKNAGSVMLAVLWMAAILTWLAAMIAGQTRLAGEEEVMAARRAQARHLAVAGVNEALARMIAPRELDREVAEDAWRPEGGTRFLQYGMGRAAVRIENERLKLNVNQADPATLQEAALFAGMDDIQAPRFVDVVGDFLDPDETPRLNGLERDGYALSGLAHPPLDGPMFTIDQLLLVPGLTAESVYDMAPASGIVRGQQVISDLMLPSGRSLFTQLTTIGEGRASTAAQRERDRPRDDFERALERREEFQAGGIYRIVSAGRSENGPPSVVLCLIVRYQPGQRPGYTVLFRKFL